ncbi:hypothetical protein R3P38DRAFT_3204304 [Favolaschia claudopus]|uniref:Uncharacterized protein n=1 Tax=Favolaschia claudopus TaxID=2862362 RepID=A0AAW0AT60_9AGAR
MTAASIASEPLPKVSSRLINMHANSQCTPIAAATATVVSPIRRFRFSLRFTPHCASLHASFLTFARPTPPPSTTRTTPLLRLAKIQAQHQHLLKHCTQTLLRFCGFCTHPCLATALSSPRTAPTEDLTATREDLITFRQTTHHLPLMLSRPSRVSSSHTAGTSRCPSCTPAFALLQIANWRKRHHLLTHCLLVPRGVLRRMRLFLVRILESAPAAVGAPSPSRSCPPLGLQHYKRSITLIRPTAHTFTHNSGYALDPLASLGEVSSIPPPPFSLTLSDVSSTPSSILCPPPPYLALSRAFVLDHKPHLCCLRLRNRCRRCLPSSFIPYTHSAVSSIHTILKFTVVAITLPASICKCAVVVVKLAATVVIYAR